MRPHRKRYIHRYIIFLALSIPLIVALKSILTGNIPFWYDNARDMLSAWDNLNRLTLIGPTSGISGIFYGPYWIWLLSIGLVFSKDPRIATVVVGILPYFIIFPFVLLQFSKLFRLSTIIILWLLFMFSTGIDYATIMWNPHVAPLLFLIMVYLVVFTDESNTNIISYLKTLLAGFIAGLVTNFHISFGLGVFLGTFLFFLIDFLIKFGGSKAKRRQITYNYIMTMLLFLFGVIIAYIPFLLFEVRHGFNQIETSINAFTKYGAVVSLKGLSKEQILQSFFGRSGDLLHINGLFAYIVDILTLGYFFIAWRSNRIKFQGNEKRLIIFLSAISIGILFIYLTAKNPVWSYHFISIEIIFLLLIALIISKISILRYLLTVWVIYLLFLSVLSFTKSFNTNSYTSSSLFTKEHIVDIVAKDAGNNFYTVFNYSPSIYQYEYTYLFRWRWNKDVPFDPSNSPKNNPLVYLIIPAISEDARREYINYRTPDKQYKTTKSWEIPNGTIIIKREK